MINSSDSPNKKKTSIRMGVGALALAGLTAITLPAPAFADGWHGRGHGGGGWHDGGGRGGHGGDGAGIAIAAGVGLLLGATLMASQQPAYYNPPQPAYAPPAAYYGRNAYYDEPVEAVPASEVYRSQAGDYCREYQSTTRIGGRLQNTYGTACQDQDGTWRIVN